MGFFQTLGRILGGRPKLDESQQQHLVEAWGLYDETPHELASFPEPESEPLNRASRPAPHAAAPDSAPPAAGTASAYDRAQWQKKLKHILETLPGSRPRWPDLVAEIGPLGLDAGWVQKTFREEFTLMVRRAVADRSFSEEDHARLDLARQLIGLDEPEAEAIVHAVVAETEAFFGKPVAGA